MGKVILRSLAVFLIVFLVLALRPVNTDEANREIITGTVEQIYDISSGDIIFKLQDKPTEYYINRGKQQGLFTDELRADLLNIEVKIEYADHWTPLDPRGRHKHITGLIINGVDIYRE